MQQGVLTFLIRLTAGSANTACKTTDEVAVAADALHVKCSTVAETGAHAAGGAV